MCIHMYICVCAYVHSGVCWCVCTSKETIRVCSWRHWWGAIDVTYPLILWGPGEGFFSILVTYIMHFFLLWFCTCFLVYLVSDLLDPPGFLLSLSFLFDVLYWPSLGQIFFIILVQGTPSASSSVFSSASTSASTSAFPSVSSSASSSASTSVSSSFLPLLSGFVYCPSALCSRPSGPMTLSPPIYCHKELKCIPTYF